MFGMKTDTEESK